MKKLFSILGVLIFSVIIITCKKEESNQPPKINDIQVNPSEIYPNAKVIITAIVTDSDGDNLTYTWNCTSGLFTSTTGQSVNWTAPPEKGSVTINITVSDGKNTTTESKTITIIAGKARIEGYVYYSGTKIPISGVTITVNNKNYTTNSTGSYSISEIAHGSSELIAIKPDFDPYSKSINLTIGTNNINIEMTSGVYTNTINGAIKTAISTIIPGVIVTLLNEDNTNTNIYDQTDASGNYQLPAVPQGQRKIAFSKTGFNDDQKLIYVSNASRTFDAILSAKIIAPPNPTTDGRNIKWSSSFGSELLGFNVYRSNSSTGALHKD